MYQAKDQLAEETALKILQILSDGKLTYSDWDNVKIKVNVYLDNSIVINFPDAAGEVEEVKEVKRHAKPGEWIRVTNATLADNCYANGDVLKVIGLNKYYEVAGCYAKTPKTHPCCGYQESEVNCSFLCNGEYVVLENYQPPEDKPCN